MSASIRPFKAIVCNIVVDRFKKFCELPDLTNYVQMDNQECKNHESHSFTIKISMKIAFIGVRQ